MVSLSQTGTVGAELFFYKCLKWALIIIDTTIENQHTVFCLLQEMEKYFVRTGGTALPRAAQEQLRPISICIMDEASQCVEPEALIPLKLGFTKVST